MSAARRRISIHDYPEHLNPFSETHLTFQDKRKIIADKLRKNGTWSSKISKRLSRSVSWLEKPWLTAEESLKKTRTNGRVCDRVHDDEPAYPNEEQINGMSRTDSYLDVRHGEDHSPIRTPIAHEYETQTTQNCSKPEPKRRKKRPAPLPPIADTKSGSNEDKKAVTENDRTETAEKTTLHGTPTTDTVSDDQNIKYENPNSSNTLQALEEVTETCQTNCVDTPEPAINAGNDSDEREAQISERDSVSLHVVVDGGNDGDADKPAQHCDRLESSGCKSNETGDHKSITDNANEQPATGVLVATAAPAGNAKTNDENQNNDTVNPTSVDDDATKRAEALTTTQANEEQVLDENANVSCVQSASPKTNDGLSMHCNGKAVMV